MDKVSSLGALSGIKPVQIGPIANQKQGSGSVDFSTVLDTLLSKVSSAQSSSSKIAMGLQTGDPSVSVEDVAIASNEAALKFQMLVSTRGKVMQAYSEVMSMPI